VNGIRQALAAVLLVALATCAADARQHGRAHRHGQQAAPVATVVRAAPASPAGNNATANPNSGTPMRGADGQKDGAAKHANEPLPKRVRNTSPDRDHRGPASHPNSAVGNHATGAPAHHGINVDLIFVRPTPGRDGKQAVKPLAGKKAATAGQAAPIHHRRERRDANASAKNAIGLTAKPPGIAGAGQMGPALNAIGTAKPNPASAHVAPPSPAPPATTARPGAHVGGANPGNSPAGTGAIATPSPHGGGINGTGLGRPGSGPATIGGPAKVAVGITGTGVRPKR
jgi:hypothetical protein